MNLKAILFVIGTFMMFTPTITLVQELYSKGVPFTPMMLIGAVVFCLGWILMLAGIVSEKD